MRGVTTVAAAVGIALFPLPALAWDYPGHRIVGAIADLVLQQHYPHTYKRVSDLLEIKRPGDLWQRRTLREVAVFPDCAKKGNEPYCQRPSSEEELSYAEHNPQNDKFHYTDVPLQQPRMRLRPRRHRGPRCRAYDRLPRSSICARPARRRRPGRRKREPN